MKDLRTKEIQVDRKWILNEVNSIYGIIKKYSEF